VTSRTTERFRKAFDNLPEQIQRRAREAYQQFQQDPYYPSLRFRQVHPTLPVYSARINRDYRAVGIRTGESIIWFWIGSHAEYEELLEHL
jgi:hypothetical protein